MLLKIIFGSLAVYNILWTGDYIKGFLALLSYEVIDILQRLDKLERKNESVM